MERCTKMVKIAPADRNTIKEQKMQRVQLRCKRRTDLGNFGLKLPETVARRNERERNRVRFINKSFTVLKNCLPEATKRKKMSKVETLRRAIEYINDLQCLLNDLNSAGNYDNMRQQTANIVQIQPGNVFQVFNGHQLFSTNGQVQKSTNAQFINLADLQRRFSGNGFTTLNNITLASKTDNVVQVTNKNVNMISTTIGVPATTDTNFNFLGQFDSSFLTAEKLQNCLTSALMSPASSVDSLPVSSASSPGSAVDSPLSSSSLETSFDDVMESEDSDLLDLSEWFE